MAISVDPLTYIITIPEADLTLVSPGFYTLDTNAFRLELKSWEDSPEGIVQPKTHDHNTEVTVAGTTFARTIEILPPYSVEFEDGQYTVTLINSNNNIFDVENGILERNQVQVIPTNSAGLIIGGTGGGSEDWTAAEKQQIRRALGITGDTTDTEQGELQDTKDWAKKSSDHAHQTEIILKNTD